MSIDCEKSLACDAKSNFGVKWRCCEPKQARSGWCRKEKERVGLFLPVPIFSLSISFILIFTGLRRISATKTDCSQSTMSKEQSNVMLLENVWFSVRRVCLKLKSSTNNIGRLPLAQLRSNISSRSYCGQIVFFFLGIFQYFNLYMRGVLRCPFRTLEFWLIAQNLAQCPKSMVYATYAVAEKRLQKLWKKKTFKLKRDSSQRPLRFRYSLLTKLSS